MYPLYGNYNNISGFKDGDGRNNELFKFIKANDLKIKDDALEYAEFINEIIFTEPMNKRELEATVDSAIKENAITSDTFNYQVKKREDAIIFAEWLVEKLDIKLYKGKLWFKDGIRYLSDEVILKRKISEEQSLVMNLLNETFSQLYLKAEYIPNHKEFNIKLNNGTLINNTVAPITAGFTPFYVDVDYNEESYDEHVDKFLNFLACDDVEVRMVLEELIGHMLMTKGFIHKMYFLAGDGSNGKSSFIEMITDFMGELSSHIDIDGFQDGTQAANLIGKLVNLADDIDPNYIEKSKTLKTMASGNTISVRPIYSQPVKIQNTATLIFTCNTIPIFKDKTYGIKRRVVIIPFRNKITKPDFNLQEKLRSKNAKSYILNLALKGMTRLIHKKEHTDSKIIKDTIKKYEIESDNVLGFLEEVGDISGNETQTVYMQYEIYCDNNGYKALANNNFGKRLKEAGYESKQIKKNKKHIRIYEKE